MMRNIALIGILSLGAVASGVIAAVVIDGTNAHPGQHRVAYEHCTVAEGSDDKMRQFGYEQISAEDQRDHILQHWSLRHRSADMPQRIDIDIDAEHACIARVEWR